MTSGSARAGTEAGLLGRREELGELMAGLDDARHGRGRLFLLAGEGGIGKTRLLEALIEETEPTEVRAVQGRCWDARAAPPFWPWAEVVRACLTQMPGDAAVRGLGRGATDVARLVPELAARLPGVIPAPPSRSPDARLRLFDSVTELLHNLGADGGLIVALDDLHAADEASLRLLLHAAEGLTASNVLLIGTYRDAEVRSAPHLHHLVAAIARRGRRMVLSGLDERDVAMFLEQFTGEAPDASWAREVHQTTDGNPFLVRELVRFLPEQPPGATDAVPEDGMGLVRRRLDAVPRPVREILTVASVIGPHFDLAMLEATTDIDPTALPGAMGEATTLELVDQLAPAHWSFRHELLREGLNDGIRASQRVALHRRVGESLEQRHAGEPDAHVAELAHHFFEAARGGDGDKARHYCTLAGDVAMASLAFEEAGVQYGRALEALALAPPVDERRRYRLLMSLAETRLRLGDLVQAQEFYRRALKSARAVGSAELLAQAAVSFLSQATSTIDDTDVSVLEEARAALPPEDSPLLARVLVALAGAARNRHAARDLSNRAVAMARRLGDPDALRGVLGQWHRINQDPDSLSERLAVADELIRLSLDAGDQEALQLARQWLASDLLAAGDVSAASAELARAVDEAQELRLPSLSGGAAFRCATVALLQGRLDDAERLHHEARVAAERSHRPDVDGAFFYQLYALRREQGHVEEMAELARRRFEKSDSPVAMDGACLALALAELGKSEEARQALESVAGELLDGSGWVRHCGPAVVADVCWLTEDVRWAAPAFERLLRWPNRHVVVGQAAASLGASDRYLAQLATLLGRLDEAEVHFQAAHDLHERLGAPGWLAHGRVDHARMLLARGSRGDAARARELLAAARQSYRASGMASHEQRVDSLGGERSPGGDGPAAESGTFSLEGEYWAIDYRGAQARLRDSKGLRYLARLLESPGQELHALDLVVGVGGRADASSGAVRQAGLETGGSGDAGAVLDAKAKAAYKRRLGDLQEEIEEATAYHDLGRVDRAQREIDFLMAELSAALGLGGRDRKAASDAERARQSVTRAIKGAIDRIAEAHPALGEHLRTTVRTGIYSSYAPDPRAPLRWNCG